MNVMSSKIKDMLFKTIGREIKSEYYIEYDDETSIKLIKNILNFIIATIENRMYLTVNNIENALEQLDENFNYVDVVAGVDYI